MGEHIQTHPSGHTKLKNMAVPSRAKTRVGGEQEKQSPPELAGWSPGVLGPGCALMASHISLVWKQWLLSRLEALGVWRVRVVKGVWWVRDEGVGNSTTRKHCQDWEWSGKAQKPDYSEGRQLRRLL